MKRKIITQPHRFSRGTVAHSAAVRGRRFDHGGVQIAETQLGLRDSCATRPQRWISPTSNPSQTAFRACKEPMSDIWRWPMLKLKIGNTVAAENYYQHAEHYFRSMRSKINVTSSIYQDADRPKPIRGALKACARLRIDLESNRAQCAGSAPFGRFKRGRIKR